MKIALYKKEKKNALQKYKYIAVNSHSELIKFYPGKDADKNELEQK